MLYKIFIIPALIAPLLFADIVNISPSSLDFGSNPLGISSSQLVTLSNPTKRVLNISSIAATGDFSSPASTCGDALWPDQQCVITIAFRPTALGTQTGVLSVNDDAGDGTQKVKLSGNGTPAVVISILVYLPQVTVIRNKTQQLIATAVYSYGSNVDITGLAQWSSNAVGVATVSATGLVTAIGPGTTTVQASYASLTGGSTVIVPQPVLTGIRVQPRAVFLSPGVSQQFTALGIYDNGASTQDITSSITNWTSSDSSTCLIDAKGLAICSRLGKAFISVQGPGGITGGCFIESAIEELFHGLSSERYWHTSTFLPNGSVLLAGGSSTIPASGQATAELYNSSTGGFIGTGSMTTPRFHHTATLIPFTYDVLVAGGDAAGLTTEMYNMFTGVFTPTASFNIPRQGHTASVLNNGKLLIAGGYTATAELYDYLAGTFTLTASMGQDRHDHTATELRGSGVLITGGVAGDGTYLSSAELYDPVTETFSSLPAMGAARASHTATLLNDGRVLIAGGYDGTSSLRSTEIYDPVTRTFSPGPSMTVARDSHTATPLLVLGNRVIVLMVGGKNQSGILSSGEIYDPGQGFLEIGNLATPNFWGYRVFHAATLIGNKQVLITGGYNGPPNTKIGELFISQQ